MLFTTACPACDQPASRLCTRCRLALAAVPSATAPGGVRAAFRFEGPARQLVLAMKYRNRRKVADALAAQIVHRLAPPDVHLVTWAPTSSRRAGRRGYDHAELLARAVARRLGVPCRRMLYRRHGGAQTGRSRADRLRGPSFSGRPCHAGLRVLLVDDVVTTGATMAAASSALRCAGVADVVCIAAAATPVHARPARPARPALLRAG
jgi:ComF family protein